MSQFWEKVRVKNVHKKVNKTFIKVGLRFDSYKLPQVVRLIECLLQTFYDTPINLYYLCCYFGLVIASCMQILLFCWPGQKLMDQVGTKIAV